jgi:ribosome-associated protein
MEPTMHHRRSHDLPVAPAALTFETMTSPGPGGQNVNKVASAVRLRLDLAASGLPEPVQIRAARLAGRRLSRDGEILIVAHRFRSQADNRRDALLRLAALLEAAAHVPVERRETRPGRGAVQRRLVAKARRSSVKAARARIEADD